MRPRTGKVSAASRMLGGEGAGERGVCVGNVNDGVGGGGAPGVLRNQQKCSISFFWAIHPPVMAWSLVPGRRVDRWGLGRASS